MMDAPWIIAIGVVAFFIGIGFGGVHVEERTVRDCTVMKQTIANGKQIKCEVE